VGSKAAGNQPVSIAQIETEMGGLQLALQESTMLRTRTMPGWPCSSM
jgi:hypothetical protein